MKRVQTCTKLIKTDTGAELQTFEAEKGRTSYYQVGNLTLEIKKVGSYRYGYIHVASGYCLLRCDCHPLKGKITDLEPDLQALDALEDWTMDNAALSAKYAKEEPGYAKKMQDKIMSLFPGWRM